MGTSARAEVELHKIGSWWRGRNDIELCDDVLSRRMCIPEGTTCMYAVFTKNKKLKSAFTLSRPYSYKWSRLKRSNIRETSAYLMESVRVHLADMYKEGYRYVHFEVEA